MTELINAFSVDLEDWYHPYLLTKYTNLPKTSLVNESTQFLLTILHRHKVKATFFILGEIAAENEKLIKEIHADGHEIACHGFSHRTLAIIGPDGLRAELDNFRQVISGILGNAIEIKGFRAPTFSLNQSTAWAIDILKEFNYKYDSSIFPMKLGLYGINGVPLTIYGINSANLKTLEHGSCLKEFPISVFDFGKIRLPVSGGFFLRLIPACLQRAALKSINRTRPFIIYVHPWECNKNIPRIRANLTCKFVTYHNIKNTLNKLRNLLDNFRFGRIDTILGA